MMKKTIFVLAALFLFPSVESKSRGDTAFVSWGHNTPAPETEAPMTEAPETQAPEGSEGSGYPEGEGSEYETPAPGSEGSEYPEGYGDHYVCRCPAGPPGPPGAPGAEEIGRAVQQECRDRSRMPSSA
eukprot:TRINITY_DN4859_c0_g2_i2.p2 TRINITY_DN4859_c0_g2~~TRINITY_DN4859_c0_g2_i2.p2  ORF type:complete len:128 (-),score=15.12 TRINITY_DN4859_c0_g2_i2:37-420(-)